MFYLRLRAQSVRFIILSLSNLGLLISFNIYFIAVRETGLIGIFYSMLLTRLLLFIVVAIPILIRVGVSFSGSLAGKILKFSWPLSLSDWFRLGVNESDKYFINFFFSPFETGIYTIAYKIGTAVHSLITVPFLQSFVPKRFEIMKAADAREVYARILNYYLLIVGSASLILSLFAKEILVIMATEKFYEAADYIFLFISAWIIFGIRYHFETGILIEKKTKYFAYINGSVGIMTIVMNYFLIGRFGLWGALLALNISQLVTTLSFYIISQRLYRISYDYQFMMKLFGMMVVLFLVAKMVPMQNLAIGIMVKIVLFGIYFSGLFFLGLIDREIMTPLKRALVKACNYL
jgi:O-antigen/teichoic acid export membrane protein